MVGLRPSRRALGLAILVGAIVAVMASPPASAIAGRIGASFPATGPGDLSAGTSPTAAGNAMGASGPSLVPLTSSRSAVLSGLSPALLDVPWIESLIHPGPSLKPLVSLPNLALLKDPPSASADRINPFYVAEPAPLGLGDFGLGAKPYSYTATHFMGEVTFSAPPNVTDPGSSGLVEPGGAHDGYVGNEYEFGIQLNTVATNISIPGSAPGFFWTQNVVNWNGTGIHFVDDTFNLTSASVSRLDIQVGTIYSGCQNNTTGANKILRIYGGVFQCIGGTIPVGPSSYPVTLQLYNNATVDSEKRSEVSYGYRIVESGTGQVYTGVSDAIVFNSPGAPHKAPPHAPGFSVDGFAPSPGGLFQDAEIVLAGDIGGDNSAFRSVNGTVHLEYSTGSAGSLKAVPSAYNFGTDTGETATGIADYWTTSHALEIHQGPTMLYGLWNAEPDVSVKSGDIHLAGSVTPSYGFVFVSNSPPVLDPWSPHERDNLSWLPTTDSGAFSTYLPPLGSPWTSEYYVQAFAAGYGEVNGTAITGSDSSYRLDLPAAHGVLRAPLYAYSNAQASALAKAVTGSSATPYDFADLTVNVNFTFDHLNDYGYPTFVLFMAQGVTKPIKVDNTYEGVDSSRGDYFILDYSDPAEQGLLAPGPTSLELPFGTSGIDLFDGTSDVVTDQRTAAEGYGLQIVLWQDSDAEVSAVTSELDSFGVWIGDSVGTQVTDVDVASGADGITDVGSSHTSGSHVAAVDALGVEGVSSSDGTFSEISASNDGIGVSTGVDYGSTTQFDPYYYLPGTTGLTLHDLSAFNGSLGANVTLSTKTTVTGVSVNLESDGVDFDNSPHGTISGITSKDHSTGAYLYHSSAVKVTSVTANDETTGVQLDLCSDITVSNVDAVDLSIGVYVEDSTDLHLSDVTASDDSIAIYYAP